MKQRIALRCELKPLDLPDTAAYIASRIRTAGGDPANIFTRQAVTLIHQHSHGLPRLISVICDNALTSGFALDQRPVDGHIVLEVCQDFDLKAAAEPVPAPQAAPAPVVVDRPQPPAIQINASAPAGANGQNGANGQVVKIDDPSIRNRTALVPRSAGCSGCADNRSFASGQAFRPALGTGAP